MAALEIRKDRTPAVLRREAKGASDARVARRILAIANALDGRSGEEAARAASEYNVPGVSADAMTGPEYLHWPQRAASSTAIPAIENTVHNQHAGALFRGHVRFWPSETDDMPSHRSVNKHTAMLLWRKGQTLERDDHLRFSPAPRSPKQPKTPLNADNVATAQLPVVKPHPGV